MGSMVTDMNVMVSFPLRTQFLFCMLVNEIKIGNDENFFCWRNPFCFVKSLLNRFMLAPLIASPFAILFSMSWLFSKSLHFAQTYWAGPAISIFITPKTFVDLDVDECLVKGGVDGNYCQRNTRCVNTPGSYICECLPGHRRVDSYNCAEMDECATQTHHCDAHAICTNTLGSYHCTCQQGYTGDGYSCTRKQSNTIQ